jgi:hypothetical protein
LVRGDRRPAAAGGCLALVSVKPQLAVSLALFLILVGRWRVVLWSVPATAGLVGLSVLAFGIKPWLNFFDWTVPFHARMFANLSVNAFWMMSVYTAAIIGGLPRWTAWGLQLAFSMVVMGTAILLFIRKENNPRTVALGLFAAVAALPYSAIYDLAIVTPALTVALFADRAGEDRPFLPHGLAAALWLAPSFAIVLGLVGLPLVPAVIAATLLVALYGQCRPRVARLDAPGVPYPAGGRKFSMDALSRNTGS